MQKENSLKRKAPDSGFKSEVKSKPAAGKPEFKKTFPGKNPAFGGKPGFNRPGGNRFGKPGQYGNNKPYNRNGSGGGGGGGRQFPNNNKPAEKQDWNKLKQDKKELKIKRKERRVKDKDIFELTFQAKKIYEKLKWWVLLGISCSDLWE